MKVGLIDVDGHNFPSLPLMKISAWHKRQGDDVQWYDPLTAWKNPLDRVYMSKVFTFTPDYSIYFEKLQEVKQTAYGFLTRGCPRGCDFCIVGKKEGRRAYKVADLSEFWSGQKNIVLLDPNFFACCEWEGLARQLIDSKAWIDFSQGCDIRTMTQEKAEHIKQMKIKRIHFAWDRYGDKEAVIPKFKEFREITGWERKKLGVYVLCNFDTTFGQDLERVYILRDLGYAPYVMLYDKQNIQTGSRYKKLQRWVNNRIIFNSCKRFEDFA